MSTRRRLAESTRSTSINDQAQENEQQEHEREEDEEEEEGDVSELEEEVAEMAKKLKDYRSTLPQHMKSTLSSLLESQRPPLLPLSPDVSHLLPGGESSSQNSSRELTAGEGEKTVDEIKLLKDKISSNITAMPKVLKRMNECMSRLDRLISSNETIHPAFKRKKS